MCFQKYQGLNVYVVPFFIIPGDPYKTGMIEEINFAFILSLDRSQFFKGNKGIDFESNQFLFAFKKNLHLMLI